VQISQNRTLITLSVITELGRLFSIVLHGMKLYLLGKLVDIMLVDILIS